MLDANARYLNKGIYFFAETWFSNKSTLPSKLKSQKDKSVILCKMLSNDHMFPSIEIHPEGGDMFIYTEDTSLVDSLIFSGYVNEYGELASFIDEDMKHKAELLWKEFEGKGL